LELAGEKAETNLPVMTSVFEKEARQVTDNVAAFAAAEFESRLNRVVEKMAAQVREEYPDLTDEQLERFVAETEKQFHDLFMEASQHILDQSLPHIAEMKSLSEELVHDQLPASDMELYQLFIHNLLMLLDIEIMEG
jgi:hypothetical protein